MRLPLLVIILGLGGCSAPNRQPSIPVKEHTHTIQTGAYIAEVKACTDAGYYTTSHFRNLIRGIHLMDEHNGSEYTQAVLEIGFDSVNKPSVTELSCKERFLILVSYTEQLRATAASKSRALDARRNKPKVIQQNTVAPTPKTEFCNYIGSQRICSKL